MPANSYQAWTVNVPGRFRSDVTYLDLETRKVPASDALRSRDHDNRGFITQSGELLRQRWSAFMAGVTSLRRITIIERTGSEQYFLQGVREAICSNTIVYSATRQFDEMVLKGLFTNARRAHEPTSFFPSLPDAESFRWLNLQPFHGYFDRGEDVPSKRVPAAYDAGDRIPVLVHNLRDVVELVLWDGDADEECADWCRKVLYDFEFAMGQIYG
jgi:hypothetical protein